jgi:hypothetical protein
MPKFTVRCQKEERAHDAKLTAANGKIKQAGQLYERKVKKNPSNAAEEHARYINTLSTLGPEVSQEKQLASPRRSPTLFAILTFLSSANMHCQSINNIPP